MGLDSSILLFLQSIRNPITDPIMTVFSVLGNAGILWIVIALVLLITQLEQLVRFVFGMRRVRSNKWANDLTKLVSA